MESITNVRAATLPVGDTLKLQPKVLPADASNPALSYESSAPTVASVDADGTVHALHEGTANIIIRAKDESGTSVKVPVTVYFKYITSIQDVDSVELFVGEAHQLSPQILPADAMKPELSYKSSAPAIASVSADGQIQAVKPGRAVISINAMDGSKVSAKVEVLVKPILVSSISASFSRPLFIGEKYKLSVNVLPENATNAALSFESSNPAAVSVSSSGEMSARQYGDAVITIRATDGSGIFTKLTIQSRRKVELRAQKISANLGEPFHIIAADGSEVSYSFSSSNKKVAKVSSSGIVTPLAEGSAVITAKFLTGKKTLITVKVVDPYKPTSVKIRQGKSVTINKGDTLQLEAVLGPSTAKSELKWSSASKKYATVSSSGLVTAVVKGSTKITVKTYNGKTAVITVKVVVPAAK